MSLVECEKRLVDALLGVILPARRLYVRFDSERMRISEPATTLDRQFPARLALGEAVGGERFCLAVGDLDDSTLFSSTEVISPFAHPRVVIGDYLCAVALLRHGLTLCAGRWRTMVRPDLVVHPTAPPADGLSDIEQIALLDMAADAGARRAGVHVGADLSADEVAAFDCATVAERR